MNLFYFFINLPLLGLAFLLDKKNNNNIKLCINCKYVLPNTFIFPNYEFAKCSIYKRIKYDDNYLVTGKEKKDKIEYTYCSICRNNKDMCGEEGKDFISKYEK
jgi:hypothetical protein